MFTQQADTPHAVALTTQLTSQMLMVGRVTSSPSSKQQRKWHIRTKYNCAWVLKITDLPKNNYTRAHSLAGALITAVVLKFSSSTVDILC